MHRERVGLVALDFVLRILLARSARLAKEHHILVVHLGDASRDVTDIGIPGSRGHPL